MKRLIILSFMAVPFLFTSCVEEDEPNVGDVATVATPTLLSQWTNQNSGMVEVSSNIVDDGGSEIISRGFIYSTNQDPEFGKSGIQSTGMSSTFEGRVIGLMPGNTWYMRAYARNDAGYGYSSSITIMTN